MLLDIAGMALLVWGAFRTHSLLTDPPGCPPGMGALHLIAAVAGTGAGAALILL